MFCMVFFGNKMKVIVVLVYRYLLFTFFLLFLIIFGKFH